jgi:THO complex subunit 5
MFNNTESLRLEVGVDEERQRKRLKKVGSDEGGVYQVHPLKVVLHVYDDEITDPKSHELVMLKFEYLLKLNVVCVGIEESEDGLEKNILCNLFPDDSGLEPPHQSAKLILGNDHVFDKSRTSRPYKWAQHLAGIETLPEMSPFFTDKDIQYSDTAKGYASASDHRNVQTVLQRIRSQKKTKLTLV